MTQCKLIARTRLVCFSSETNPRWNMSKFTIFNKNIRCFSTDINRKNMSVVFFLRGLHYERKSISSFHLQLSYKKLRRNEKWKNFLSVFSLLLSAQRSLLLLVHCQTQRIYSSHGSRCGHGLHARKVSAWVHHIFVQGKIFKYQFSCLKADDHLAIFDGKGRRLGDPKAPNFDPLLAHLCGKSTTAETVISSNPNLYMEFKSGVHSRRKVEEYVEYLCLPLMNASHLHFKGRGFFATFEFLDHLPRTSLNDHDALPVNMSRIALKSKNETKYWELFSSAHETLNITKTLTLSAYSEL